MNMIQSLYFALCWRLHRVWERIEDAAKQEQRRRKPKSAALRWYRLGAGTRAELR